MNSKDIRIQKDPELIASGFIFTEGPVWHPDGYLLFSDIPANTIYSWSPNKGTKTYISNSNNANGLTFDLNGDLIICEHSGRRVSRMSFDGTLETIASHYLGKRLNSPNDVVVHSNGEVYFTDPAFGINPSQEELGFKGVFRIKDDTTLELLISDFSAPNGLAFSPDESTLYVDDSIGRATWAFALGPNGRLSNDRILVNQDLPDPGSPDGMKVDMEGNVYVTGAGGLWIVDPVGNHIDTLKFPEQPSNLAFGDSDMMSIYVTARTSIYKIRTNVPGARVS